MSDSFLSSLELVVGIVVSIVLFFHAVFYIRTMSKVGAQSTNLSQIATSAIVSSLMTAGYAGIVVYALLNKAQ